MGSSENRIREICTNGSDEIMRINHDKNEITLRKGFRSLTSFFDYISSNELSEPTHETFTPTVWI